MRVSPSLVVPVVLVPHTVVSCVPEVLTVADTKKFSTVELLTTDPLVKFGKEGVISPDEP